MEFLKASPEDEIMAAVVDLGLCDTFFLLTIDLENGCVIQVM